MDPEKTLTFCLGLKAEEVKTQPRSLPFDSGSWLRLRRGGAQTRCPRFVLLTNSGVNLSAPLIFSPPPRTSHRAHVQGGQWLCEETAAGFARTTAADVLVLKVGQVFAAGGTAVMLWSLRKHPSVCCTVVGLLKGAKCPTLPREEMSQIVASNKNVISCVQGFSPALGRGINSLMWTAFRSSLQLADL